MTAQKRRLPLKAAAAVIGSMLFLSGCSLSPIDKLAGTIVTEVSQEERPTIAPTGGSAPSVSELRALLNGLVVDDGVRGTGYQRTDFLDRWPLVNGCDVRNRVLARDLQNTVLRKDGCTVASGTLTDPYDGARVDFAAARGSSGGAVIDHTVSLIDAYRSGAKDWPAQKKQAFAIDEANLQAVSDATNGDELGNGKSGKNAADWRAPTSAGECFFARSVISVKTNWVLTVTATEKTALADALGACTKAAP